MRRLARHLNALDMGPSAQPADARKRGRYAIENSVRVDVLVARAQSTKDGAIRLSFDDCWSRRQTVKYGGIEVFLPSIADLVTTKRWNMRVKDLPDIQLLESLRREVEGG